MEEVAALVVTGIINEWNVLILGVVWLCLARGLSLEGVMNFWAVSIGCGGQLLGGVHMVWWEDGLFRRQWERRGMEVKFTILRLVFIERLCQGAEVPVQVPEILDRAISLWFFFFQVLGFLNISLFLYQLMLLENYLLQNFEFIILKVLHQQRL